MFLSNMTKHRKIFVLLMTLGIFAVGVGIFPPNLSLAASTKTKPIKVIGMAQFVLKGTVVSTSANAVTLHVTNTSKNAKLFDNKNKTIVLGSQTTVTKNGKKILLTQIKSGNKVKVFGIFDKKSGSITLARWVKVVP